jgi:ABC-type Mn2+/Zn2+ transport system permease subunit
MASITIALVSFIHDSIGDPSNATEDWIFGLLFEAFVGALAASIGFGGIAASDPTEEDRFTAVLFSFFFGVAIVAVVIFAAGMMLFAWYSGYADARQLIFFTISLCPALITPVRSIMGGLRSRS